MDLDALFGSEEDFFGPGGVEGDTLISNGISFGVLFSDRHHLETAGIGDTGSFPGHEVADAFLGFDDRNTGSLMEMISVNQNAGSVGVFDVC